MNNVDSIKILLRYGVDIHEKSSEGKKGFDYLTEESRCQIKEYIEDYQINIL